VNTYSGFTSLNGGNLVLIGNGSIASSSLLNNGNLTVTSSNGATFSSLDGIGNINLGSYQLNLTNASGTYSGVINGTGGVALNSGSETFSGINTYTGPTLINGGTLILTGNGSITNSSSITNNGTFNIGNTSGTTITSLSGNGTTILGAQQLSFSNASGIYSGSINGTGSIALNQGSQTLLGVSNFSGGMSLSPGTTLSINSGQALGTGNITLVGSNTTAATLNILSNTTINNQIRVSGDPVFNIARGVVYTQTGVISDGISSGDVVVTGGGTLALTAPNTYTGPTTITSSTLALQGDGSIANSIGLTNNGTFDISATNGASIVSLSGNGNTNLGAKQLTLTNASGTYSGVLSGTGSFALNAGTETLSGVNTYTGGTSIQQGALLALSGNGSISKSQQLNVLGTFDISGSSNGASIVSLTGTGNVALGSNNLNLTNANDTFSGVIADGGIVNGVGGSLTISKGIETLDGINTYTGTTYIGANATLALAGVGSIENSQIVNVDGTFDISQITQTYDPDYAATFGNADIVSLAGSGRVALGSNVLIFNNANDTFSGVLADGGIGGGTAGSIYIEKGTQTLSGINTFTGEAYVEPRATLALIGQGSVATANTIVFDGVVDISGTSSGTNITGMSGYGTVYLGSKTLNITGPSNPLFETFSGDIQGTGQFNILDGTQTLSGTNHLTGDMTVTAGNTLTITSGAALGSGTLNLVGNTTTPAILSIKKSTTINNPIVISGDPTFNVAPGATYTQAGVISNGATPGDIVITGGGTVVLSAVNTYTGQTVINASSVLQLFGSGSISTSQILTNNGVFDISGALSGVSIQSLAGLGQIIRGSNVLNILDTPQIPVSSNPSQNLLIISTPVSPPQISAPIGQTITNNELSIGSKSTLIPTSTTGPTLTSPVISNNPSTANPSSNNVTSGITNTEAVQVVTQTTAVSFIDSTPTSTNSVVSSSSSNSGSSNTASTTTSSVGTSVEPSTQNTSPSSAVADSAPSPKLNSKSVPADSLDQGDTSLAQVTVPGSNAPAPKSESRRELRVSTTPVATGVAIQKVIPIKQPVTKVFQHPISGSWSGKE
jgi:autotransporter-associated beta strand protein